MLFEAAAVTDIRLLRVTNDPHKSRPVAGRSFFSLSYRMRGVITVQSDQAVLRSEPDTVTFIPKGAPYSTAILEESDMIVVHFQLTKDPSPLSPSVISAKGSALKGLFTQLAEHYSPARPTDPTCMALFYQILAEWERLLEGVHPIPAKIRAVKERMDRSFGDPYLSISDLAREEGISDSYLRRGFGDAYGISPMSYLTETRIRHAKTLLNSDYYHIYEIAPLCGFASSGYFIRCFRARTGETPHEYRKRKQSLTEPT